MEYRDLTSEELDALYIFAKRNGRIWKARLREKWMSGTFSGPLYALRNSHGLNWLREMRLPGY